MFGAAVMGGSLGAVNRLAKEIEWTNKICQERARVKDARKTWDNQVERGKDAFDEELEILSNQDAALVEEHGEIIQDKIDVQCQFDAIEKYIEDNYGEQLDKLIKLETRYGPQNKEGFIERLAQWGQLEFRIPNVIPLGLPFRRGRINYLPKSGPDLSQKDAYSKAVGDRNSFLEVLLKKSPLR